MRRNRTARIERRLASNLRQHKERAKILHESVRHHRDDAAGGSASLTRSVYQDCRYCHGTGLVKTGESVALDVMRIIQLNIIRDPVRVIELTVSPEVANHLLNRKRAALANLAKYRRTILIRPERTSVDNVECCSDHRAADSAGVMQTTCVEDAARKRASSTHRCLLASLPEIIMEPKQLGARLPQLVDRIVESYLADHRTQHIDKEFLPSTAAIIEICDMLMELTYPGYFGRMGLTRHNIAYHVGELLPRLWDQLSDQVHQALCHAAEQSGRLSEDGQACRDKAVQIASDFLEAIPNIRAQLADDVQAAYDGDPAAFDTSECILAYPAVHAITIFRYAHHLYELDVPYVPRIMCEHVHRITGIDIHPAPHRPQLLHRPRHRRGRRRNY